ncbi:hypothetical protein UFOVP112_365 [uncultured Caudovirales phage]|uniref:Uncharacterized protein n=1 Tax=uncultured Caudovirales phage TaxID=2100421 RepID=A0A6J5L8D1_9CAUD|nr:hypothetical protein UFOVP112_365 [uncultured Caudovirales phage]
MNIVLYDTIQIEDDYKQRVIDITEFFSQYPADAKIICTKELTPTLLNLAKQGQEWAFVSILGHCVSSPTVFADMITECKQNDFPLMGHIVYRPGSYPYIDNQFFVVNLQKWSKVGSPAFEVVSVPVTFTTKTVTRSQEDFHDDYTPHWISTDNTNSKYQCYQSEFASLVVRKFLEAGYTISNININLRNQKWNLYANANRTSLEPLFNGGTFNQATMPQIVKQVLDERNTLIDTVYILNSEEVYPYGPKNIGPVDHYIGVAGGFKSILLLDNLGFKPTTQVTYADISLAGLDYQKYLIDNWDGDLDTYINTVDGYKQLHPEYRYAWRSWNSWDNEIKKFLESAAMTKDEFCSVWKKYCQLKHNFLPVNLLTDYKKLIEVVAGTKGDVVYIWMSNAFDMQYTRFLLGREQTESKFNAVIAELKHLKKKITVESCAKFYNC